MHEREGNMNPQPKVKTWRSKKYLSWIRSKPCSVCDRHLGVVINPHHEQLEYQGGMGTTPGDERTIPMCFTCHRKRHDYGRGIWERWGLDPEQIINDLQTQWIQSGRKSEWVA